jgi:hypothetical protein
MFLNDVAEQHIQKERYGCFSKKKPKQSHPRRLDCLRQNNPRHGPSSPDKDQYLENVLTASLRYHGHGLGQFELITLSTI